METNERPMTIKEVLADVCGILGDINIPASRIDDIGIPIARSINGLKLCLKTIEREETKKQETSGEPPVEIGPVTFVPAEEVEGNA